MFDCIWGKKTFDTLPLLSFPLPPSPSLLTSYCIYPMVLKLLSLSRWCIHLRSRRVELNDF